MRAVTALLFLAASIAACSAQVMTADGFEEGHFDLWRVRTWGPENAGSIVEPPVPFEGKRAFRSVASKAAADVGRHWCEIGRYFGKLGDERWWGFAMLLPEGWRGDPTNVVVSQVYSRSSAEEGEGSQAPMLTMRIKGEEVLIESRYDAGRISQPERYGIGGTIQNTTLYRGPIVRGRWETWVFHARWTFESSGDGIVEVWRDGNKIAEHSGPNAYNNDGPILVRIGLYKRDFSVDDPGAEICAYYDHFVVADERGSFAMVEPRAHPLEPAGKLPTSYEGPAAEPASGGR